MKLDIPLQEVASSNVAAVGYDKATQRFAVQFKRTPGAYVYEGVDAKTAESVLTAESVGSAVQQKLVRGGLKYSHVKPEEKA